jgi:hypothetical protein
VGPFPHHLPSPLIPHTGQITPSASTRDLLGRQRVGLRNAGLCRTQVKRRSVGGQASQGQSLQERAEVGTQAQKWYQAFLPLLSC